MRDDEGPTIVLVHTCNRPPDFHVGCPLTHNRSSWCNRFCVPVGGLGACGRIAPHALRGRTQRAIDEAKRRALAGGVETNACAEGSSDLRPSA
jgi:hypothetical protein